MLEEELFLFLMLEIFRSFGFTLKVTFDKYC